HGARAPLGRIQDWLQSLKARARSDLHQGLPRHRRDNVGKRLNMTHVLMPLCALLAMALPAVAAETDDARKGRELAAEICADCHAIRPADGSSPNADAPGFETIARVPGMSPMSL